MLALGYATLSLYSFSGVYAREPSDPPVIYYLGPGEVRRVSAHRLTKGWCVLIPQIGYQERIVQESYTWKVRESSQSYSPFSIAVRVRQQKPEVDFGWNIRTNDDEASLPENHQGLLLRVQDSDELRASVTESPGPTLKEDILGGLEWKQRSGFRKFFRRGRPSPLHLFEDQEVFGVNGSESFPEILSWGLEELEIRKPGTYLFAPCPDHSEPRELQEFPGLIQVVVRSGNQYIDYLAEMRNVPFSLPPGRIWGSHAADLNLAVDCVSFAIYGRRRLGEDTPYVIPSRLHRYAIAVPGGPFFLPEGLPHSTAGVREGKKSRTATASAEAYVDSNQEALKLAPNGIVPGDIIHFGHQVAIFYGEGKGGIPDTLDSRDLIFHPAGGPVRVTEIRNGGYEDLPIQVYRWPNASGKR